MKPSRKLKKFQRSMFGKKNVNCATDFYHLKSTNFSKLYKNFHFLELGSSIIRMEGHHSIHCQIETIRFRLRTKNLCDARYKNIKKKKSKKISKILCFIISF